MSTLVPCGFLHGTHPVYLRRDEAEVKLEKSLNLGDDPIPFQQSSCTLTVPMVDGKPERFTFQAVLVETLVAHAVKLKEHFYSLGGRLRAKYVYPYTGGYQFVPLLKSREGLSTRFFSWPSSTQSSSRSLNPSLFSIFKTSGTRLVRCLPYEKDSLG